LPDGVKTTTSTVPAAPAGGAVAVIDVDELTVKLAATPPNRTAPAPVKFVPVMVTLVPPMVLPLLVPSDDTTGAEAAVKLKRAGALSAPGTLTTTSTVPAALGGVVTSTLVEDSTTKATDCPPNVTEVVPSRPVPVMVTLSPPALEPEEALSEEM